ncbi:MAG: NADH dehydrogenase subunit, partial [Bacteroidales bacterium]|nr:NADH dehydrogenase subunit [Bacteroidales bacterium]
SHPYLDYAGLNHTPVVKRHGDVYSRTQVRIYEVLQSLDYAGEIARRLQDLPCDTADCAAAVPAPDTLVVSLSEGWRGEICHVAATDAKGNLRLYKIKDPSFHNWMALALAVRGNEISDFPICNKSFNLSYCGHDL